MGERHPGTIDRSGCVVVPKVLRDELGITAGHPLRASVRDGRLEIEPDPVDVDVDGVLVTTPRGPVPTISRDDVRLLIESVRR